MAVARESSRLEAGCYNRESGQFVKHVTGCSCFIGWGFYRIQRFNYCV